jgi:hypothetical protein
MNQKITSTKHQIQNKWIQIEKIIHFKQFFLDFFGAFRFVWNLVLGAWNLYSARASLSRLGIAVVMLVAMVPLYAHAAAPKVLQTSPAVIDQKVKQRDIIKQSIILQNVGERPLKLFPAVEDINPENGDQSFGYAGNADARSDSLANWIELSRGVIELAPGESKTVPFIIHINMNAVPGQYHAALTFTDGGTRDETQNKLPSGSVAVNVEVQADIQEDLQLLKFTTNRMAFSGDDIIFNYQVENTGNQDLQPSGDIRIYDRRGQEVATIDVNKEGKSVSPKQMAQLASSWGAASGFGQFKALITVNYGRSQTAAVTDTIFFWIVPWKQILGIFTTTLIALVVLALYFRQWFEERHLNKLAVAGLLNAHPATAAAIASVPHFPPPQALPPKPIRQPADGPIRQLADQPAKERIVVRVAQNIVIAWRLFTTYKRSGRLTPEDIAAQKKVFPKPDEHQKTPAAAHAPALTPHIDTVQAEWHSSHTAHHPHSTAPHAHGDTVDLKKHRKSETTHQTGPGHVVNLKNKL